MAKVSAIIPSRNERYLIPTVDNLLAQATGDVEVIVVLEDFHKPDITPTAKDWADVQARHGNRLHTIYHHEAKGMRPAINAAAASAISRGSKYLAKFDAHCAFGEGWDTILAADCDDDWIIVPRRLRLDPDTFAPRTDGRPPIDYHYLSFPDNVHDFGGPGLNGKVWAERQRERAAIEIDDEMSSQGSGWFMHAAYFQRMGFMDDSKYGPFWNEFQELGLSCWLSGGQVKVNKRTWYAHWHKGSAGRGYHMPKEWLNAGASFTKRWMFNEASSLQTRPFSWLIEHFWPVPTWPENWEELVYGDKPTKMHAVAGSDNGYKKDAIDVAQPSLTIHTAHYGPTGTELDVADLLRSKIANDSLDLNVTNSDLNVGNPFRGLKKKLTVVYSYNGSEQVTLTKEEREWLIIGQSARYVRGAMGQVAPIETDPSGREFNSDPNASAAEITFKDSDKGEPFHGLPKGSGRIGNELFKVKLEPLMTATALTDHLIRKFQIPAHRLRGPMPIELPQFHRDDLAQLFAELGFLRGAEIGVAEGNYSEVLMKASPAMKLLLVDPWHHYSGNPQGKSRAKNEYAFNEAKRKMADYRNVEFIPKLSMDAVRGVSEGSLDFVYIDGHHGFDYVMQDLIEWSKRVRSGGLITGDDYYYLDPKRWGAGPVEAVQAYTQAHKISPWFIFQGHKSIDFMWVQP